MGCKFPTPILNGHQELDASLGGVRVGSWDRVSPPNPISGLGSPQASPPESEVGRGGPSANSRRLLGCETGAAKSTGAALQKVGVRKALDAQKSLLRGD